MSKNLESIEQLQAVVDRMLATGSDPAAIVAMLTETTVKNMQRDRDHALSHLEASLVVLSTVARIIRDRNKSEQLTDTLSDQ